MKVIRVLEYDGPRKWVEATLKKSFVQLGRTIHFGNRSIKETERKFVACECMNCQTEEPTEDKETEGMEDAEGSKD